MEDKLCEAVRDTCFVQRLKPGRVTNRLFRLQSMKEVYCAGATTHMNTYTLTDTHTICRLPRRLVLGVDDRARGHVRLVIVALDKDAAATGVFDDAAPDALGRPTPGDKNAPAVVTAATTDITLSPKVFLVTILLVCSRSSTRAKTQTD